LYFVNNKFCVSLKSSQFTVSKLMLRNSGAWSCVATDSGHVITHLQSEVVVKDMITEDTQDGGQISSEVEFRFSGSRVG
jgi:VCBS repeat-containing protein